MLVYRVKKKNLTGGVVGIFQKLGDIGSDIAEWCTYKKLINAIFHAKSDSIGI